MINIKDLLRLKIDLLIEGVALKGNFNLGSRALLSSVSEGIHFVIFKDIYITTSIQEDSSYSLCKSDTDNTIYLEGEKALSLKAELIPEGKYYGAKLLDGTLMENVGTFQTDRLRISAYKGCNFVINDESCKFCEVSQIKSQRKNGLEHIAELVRYSECLEKRIKHYLISGGTPPEDGWGHFIDVCQTVRKNTKKSIYAMFSPPPNLEIIKQIVDAGVEDIAINIELYNSNTSAKIIKGKNRIGIDRYFEALEYAVTLLGKKGNVKSVLVVGLENYEDTLIGVEELAKRGVMPILSIFKPVKGTPLENSPAPERNDLANIWEKSQNICERFSLTLGPLCKCCQNNTLTIPINNQYFKYE